MKNKLFLIASLLIINGGIISQVPSYIPSEGLVGWWPFNGNADDESDYTNDGTVYGATLTQDREGNPNAAYNFNGMSNYIEVNDDNTLDFIDNYSLSGWYRTTNQYQPLQVVLGKGNNYGGTGYQLMVNGLSTIQFGFNNGYPGNSPEVINGGANTIPTEDLLNGWHHIVGTYDGVVAKLYIDGELVGETYEVFELSISEEPLLFGKETHSILRFFNGDLDDIGMWNRALTREEIGKMFISIPTTTTDVNDTSSPTDFGGKIECYPNPTTDVINVDLSGLNDYSGQKLRIMNLSGQIVYEENVNQSKVVIDVKSLLSSGIYVINTVDQNGNISSTNKFVVQ
jgi:hypothetical protein